jgi:membrane protein YdbS with pleckstrin-like domain
MIGGLGPDDPEDESRRERDTEPIPRNRGDSRSSSDPDDEHTHFVGKATVGAGVGGGGGHAGAPTHSASDGPDDLPTFTEEELEELRFDAAGVPVSPRRVLPLEDQPSGLVARYLFPTERYRGEWKRHWVHLVNILTIGLAATLLLGFLSGVLASATEGVWVIAVVIWAFVMSWVAWRIADWYFDRFILTNKRLMVVNGLITRKIAMMPLIKVTDMKYEQTPMGRLLNYGTFVLESAGQDQAFNRIDHLPNPNELYLRIVEEMYEPAAVEARLGREAEDD